MFAHLSNRRKLISANDVQKFETRIASLESQFPVELCVVVSKCGGFYPTGQLRIIMVLLLIVQTALWYFWIPFSFWLGTIIPVLVVFLPNSILRNFNFGRFFVTKDTQIIELKRRSFEAFQRNKVGQTSSADGLLVYFSVPEKLFYFLPDTELAKRFGPEKVKATIQKVLDGISSSDSKKAQLSLAFGSLFDELENVFASSLTAKSNKVKNELANTILFES